MIQKLIRYGDLALTFLRFYFKRILQYRTDFLIGVLPLLLTQTLGLIFIQLVFAQVPELKGWSYEQVLLVYSFYIVASGLDLIVFDNLGYLKGYILQGRLDFVLIRPINPIFQILLQTCNEYAIGQILMGIAVMGYAFAELGIAMTLGTIVSILYFVVVGTMILGAFTMISVTFYFFTEGTFSPLNAVRTLDQFLKYPISIFNRFIQILLTWVLPFGFISFYPATHFLPDKGVSFPVSMVGLIVVAVLFSFAIIFFNKGIEKYQGVGN